MYEAHFQLWLSGVTSVIWENTGIQEITLSSHHMLMVSVSLNSIHEGIIHTVVIFSKTLGWMKAGTFPFEAH